VDASIFAYIVIALVAIISGTNQVLTFVERVHKYLKALNDRKKLKGSKASTRKIISRANPFAFLKKLSKRLHRSEVQPFPKRILDLSPPTTPPAARTFKKNAFRPLDIF
jgi:hypothetical protein